jgi:hypothetical protein
MGKRLLANEVPSDSDTSEPIRAETASKGKPKGVLHKGYEG